MRNNTIKLGAIYSTFYDIDLLRDSILSIRDVADVIVVVHQRENYFRVKTTEKDMQTLQQLCKEKLIDELVLDKIGTKYYHQIITDKYNAGLQILRKHNCTHVMTIDADEQYNSNEIRHYLMKDVDSVYFPIQTYYYDKRHYFIDTFYVQTINRIDERVFKEVPASLLCDPKRKMPEKTYCIAKAYMHHYSFLKDKYQNKLNGTMRIIGNKQKEIEMHQINDRLQTWQEGQKGLVFSNDMQRGGVVIMSETELFSLDKPQYTVVIPTMWKANQFLLRMLEVYEQSDYIKEVVIIDNDRAKRPVFDCSKVRILEQKENIFVNPAWNIGVHAAQTDKIILANDDIFINDFAAVMQEIDSKLKDLYIIGCHSDNYTDKKQSIKIEKAAPERNYGFGCFMVFKKNSYEVIPNDLKVAFGDDWLFRHLQPFTIKMNMETKMHSTFDHFRKICATDEATWKAKYLKPKQKKISINMATYPAREKTLPEVVAALLPQCDILRVYLNEYKHVPECLKQEKILVHIGGADLKDTGKFFWACTLKDEYYFTVDDDIIYAADYCKKHIAAIERHNAVVCSHGRNLRKNPKHWTDVESVYEYFNSIATDNYCNYCGTGTVAFDNSKLAVDLSIFKTHGMADEYFSRALQKANVPIICRRHDKSEIRMIHFQDTLWGTARTRLTQFQELFRLT